jgi:predicted porin
VTLNGNQKEPDDGGVSSPLSILGIALLPETTNGVTTMKINWSHISPIAFIVFANTAHASINMTPDSSNTQLTLGGYINGGYHGQRGDYADWTNIYSRQEAARNLDSTLNSPTASDSDKVAAQNVYQNVLSKHPYSESRDTSLSDLYLRANMALEHKVDDRYSVFALYERDFRTEEEGNVDLTRDAYVGIKSKYGNIRFGRDESALTHVRDLIYSMEEKDGYSYQSFIEPTSVTGRHDNSLIYSFDAANYAAELGYVFETEQDYISQDAYSASAKYILLESITVAAGYSGGNISADKNGNIIQPDLTGQGFSSFDVSQVFLNATYSPDYELKQKQYNVGLGYSDGDFSIGGTYFNADYSLDVNGKDSEHVETSTSLDYSINGVQASVAYAFSSGLELSSVYSRSVNEQNNFSIVNALSFGLEQSLSKEFMIYANVGANNSDASHNQFTNAGLRFNF